MINDSDLLKVNDKYFHKNHCEMNDLEYCKMNDLEYCKMNDSDCCEMNYLNYCKNDIVDNEVDDKIYWR